MAWSRPFWTCTSVTSGSTWRSSARVCRSGLPAQAPTSTGATSRAVRAPRIGLRSSPGLRLGGAVVAVREREASLVLICLEALPARLELLDRDGLEDVALPG